MRRSIAWPPELNGGRIRLTADPADATASDRGEALRQAIRLSLFDASSANPWQPQIGVPDATFGSASAGARARLEQAVVDRFAALASERRARLVSVSVSVSGSALGVRVEYEDLEQGQRRSLEVSGA